MLFAKQWIITESECLDSSGLRKFKINEISSIFQIVFFPLYFSKLWPSLNKNNKCNSDIANFKENLIAFYKVIKKSNFKYVDMFFLNTHCFVTGIFNTDICLNCNENTSENISHYVLFCLSYSLSRATMISKITFFNFKFFFP